MQVRRDIFKAVIGLGIVLSLVAIGVTLGLEALGDVSAGALAAVVAVVGFVTSWVLTGRVQQRSRIITDTHHRVSVIHVHRHAA
jgi:uncharacterized membrane protein YciS (DUF1049 family)